MGDDNFLLFRLNPEDLPIKEKWLFEVYFDRYDHLKPYTERKIKEYKEND